MTASAYQTEDGGKRTRGIDYPYVTDPVQAAQLAALQIANTREGIAGVIPLKPHLQRIRPGDAFTITEEDFVLNGVKCLCLNTDYDPATGIVRVSFVSETDAKYPFALGQSPDAPVPPVLTPVDPRYVAPPAPSEWTMTAETFTDNGAAVPALVFAGDVDNATADAVIFEFRPHGTGASWAGAGIEGPTVERKEVTGLTPGTSYDGAVSYRRGNNVSARLVLGPVISGDLVSPSVSGLLRVSSSASSVVGFRSGAGIATTPTVTLTVTGGTGTISVLWDNVGGELAAFALDDDGLTTAFRHTIAAGASDRATFLATVSDSGTGQIQTVTVGAAFVDNTT